METPEEIEFDHLERILAGVGARLSMSITRPGRTARTMLEAHMAERYDRAGCFCYVGWIVDSEHPAPSAATQIMIYGAFARAAVAANVFLGALEPKEGFGLVKWNPSDNAASATDYSEQVQCMRRAIAHAAFLVNLIAKEQRGELQVALGYGRVRGKALLWSMDRQRLLLDAPAIVATIYGDIPNRCGGLAKGKDPDGVHLVGKIGNPGDFLVYRQPWTVFANDHSIGTAQGASPMALVGTDRMVPAAVAASDLKPFLVGFSLDFAQSRKEFGINANLARTVVNRVLGEFEQLPQSVEGLFVSPRYGDGLAAVVVVPAPSAEDALKAPWFKKVEDFCEAATAWLTRCEYLGLRIGMAVEEDEFAVAPRLAGVGSVASPAVEPLAARVLANARECHALAKRDGIIVRQSAWWLYNDANTGLRSLNQRGTSAISLAKDAREVSAPEALSS